jgi:hypothetical protein
MDKIVSSKIIILGLSWCYLKSQLQKVYSQDFKKKAKNTWLQRNPRRALRENKPKNGEIINLTLRPPKPPIFIPTWRAIEEEEAEVKKEKAEVYIKEKERDKKGQY